MEEIVVTGRRETGPSSGVGYRSSGPFSGMMGNNPDAINIQNAHLLPGNSLVRSFPSESMSDQDTEVYIDEYGELNPLDLKNLNPEASYRGQTLDQMILAGKNAGNKMINTGKKFGKDIYNTAAMASTGISNIPIAGVAYQNAIAKSNPAAFLAGTVLAPSVMSDFGFAEGGEVDENRPRSAERRPYFRVPDMKTGEYDDIRLGRLRNVFTRLLRDPTDEDSTGKKLALLAGEIGLSPFKVADMFLEFSTGATPVDSLNLYYDRPERVFRDSPGVNKYSPYNVERKDYTEEFSPEEFRQYRPNDEGPRPSFIPGFQDGGPVEDKEAQRQIDRVMMAVNRLMEMGVSEEEARAVVQRHLELGPYPEQVPGQDPFIRRPSRPQTLPGSNPFNRDYSNDDSMRLLNDEMFITEDGLDLRESDGTSLNNFDEMNYKANGGQVRRRVPDMYFGRYNMGGAVAPGQISKPPMPAGNPMLKQITNTDPRYYSAPPNPMGNLAGGISNLANNQKKTNKLLGGNNKNNNAMNQNLKISYNPNPTNMEQRRVFSNVLESTRPVMT